MVVVVMMPVFVVPAADREPDAEDLAYDERENRQAEEQVDRADDEERRVHLVKFCRRQHAAR